MLYNPFVKLLKYKIWKENLYIDSETKIDYAETCRSSILKNYNKKLYKCIKTTI